MNYKQIAQNILDTIGTENIISAEHCATRLRIKVADTSVLDLKAVEKIEGVYGIKDNKNEIQVIIGQDVIRVYREVSALLDGKIAECAAEPTKKLNPIQAILMTVSDILVPLIPAIVAYGLTAVIVNLFNLAGISTETSPTLKLLSIASSAIFYFLPFLIAVSASKKFEVNTFITLCVTAALMSNEFAALADIGNYTAFLGIPVRIATYSQTIFPVIMIAFVQKYTEIFVGKIVPKLLKPVVEPLCNFLLLASLSFIVVGPIGAYLSDLIAILFQFLFQQNVVFASAFVGAFCLMLALTGTHYATFPVLMSNMAILGYDNFYGGAAAATLFAMVGTVFGIMIKTKNQELKTLAGTTGVSALLGCSEPALFGINVKYPKTLVYTCIAGGIGGLISGFLGVNSYGMAPGGLLQFPCFFGETFFHYLIAIIVAFVIGMLLVLVLGYESKEVRSNAK